MLEPLRTARLVETTERVKEARGCDVWRGTIDDGGHGEWPAYIKVGSRPQLFAEIACARIGRALGLPIPAPYVVAYEPGDLPGNTLDTDGLAYGSAAMQLVSFARWLRVPDNDDPINALQHWPQLLASAIFDEWVANVDRNPNNILFNGLDTCYLIDHAEAFGGASWPVMGLDAQATHSDNYLLRAFRHNNTEFNEARVRRQANRDATQYHQIDTGQLASHGLLPDDLVQQLRDYLTERALNVPEMVATRCQTKQPSLSLPT